VPSPRLPLEKTPIAIQVGGRRRSEPRQFEIDALSIVETLPVPRLRTSRRESAASGQQSIVVEVEKLRGNRPGPDAISYINPALPLLK
jgi:hypothetical protein